MANNTSSRFSVDKKTEIKEKYVLYVEDLFVSFRANSAVTQLKEIISSKEELLKQNRKIFNEPQKQKIQNEITAAKDILNNKEIKEQIEVLKMSTPANNEEAKEIKKNIKELKDSMLTRKSKNIKEVLKGVTLGLREGETLAIVGANGAGKTVLLETIMGFNIPTKYNKLVLNLGHKKYADNLKEIGMQFQQAKMPSNFKVRDAIDNQIRLFGKRIDKFEVSVMIEEFGIFEFIESPIESLSGGQKQRLNLLLALMHQPKIMILDEFITGLDVNSVRRIITYVNDLKVKNNSSMIVVSHQPEEIESLADRIVVMKNGKVVEEKNVATILKEYGTMASFVEAVI